MGCGGPEGVAIHRLTALDLRLVPGRWRFEAENEARIARHWAAARAANPALFNGRVLMMTRWSLGDGTLSGEFVKADFASLLAWRDWGFPDRSVLNCFGSAAILSGDGALIYGEMASHTANAGRIYPPGGSLEPGDVTAGGAVDLRGSIARELAEETGLDAGDATEEGLIAVQEGPRLSVALCLRFGEPAAALIARIGAHLGAEATPELARVMTVATLTAGESARMPPYADLLAQATGAISGAASS